MSINCFIETASNLFQQSHKNTIVFSNIYIRNKKETKPICLFHEEDAGEDWDCTDEDNDGEGSDKEEVVSKKWWVEEEDSMGRKNQWALF